MTIFVSDTHFGRSTKQEERTSELELIACLESVRDDLDAVFLVGDIFEHFIEYRHVVPKGFVRFQACLAGLTDSGVPVKYVVGNHDPWHRDYFAQELGVEIVQDFTIETLYGRTVYVAHGDGLGPEAGAYPFVKPVLRHPFPVGIFRGLLPSDLGMGIAKWYSRHFRSEEVNDARTRSLRQAALELLRTNPYDIIVMGHSHVAELLAVEEGTYVNCGCWYSDRTVAVLAREGPSLMGWTETGLVDCNLPATQSD